MEELSEFKKIFILKDTSQFSTWQWQTRIALKSQGLLSYIQHDISTITDKSEEKDVKAQTLIIERLSFELKQSCEGKESAYAIWKHLEKSLSPAGYNTYLGHLHQLKFSSIRAAGDDVEKYINTYSRNIADLNSSCKAEGFEPIAEAHLASFFLLGLRNGRFDTFIATQQSLNEISLNRLYAALRQELAFHRNIRSNTPRGQNSSQPRSFFSKDKDKSSRRSNKSSKPGKDSSKDQCELHPNSNHTNAECSCYSGHAGHTCKAWY